jgi:SEC-C motif-containing protein
VSGPACPCGPGTTTRPAAGGSTLALDPGTEWKRLAVLETEDGGMFDQTGTVTFRAVYLQNGQRGVLAEKSRFVREGGRWLYLAPSSGGTPS